MGASSSSDDSEMFRPPVNRLMKVLDRSFFQKKIPISAARIFDKKNIAKCRTELRQDALQLDRLLLIRPVPESESRGAKDMLLKPEIDPEDASTWSKKLQELADVKEISVMRYYLDLNYDYWNYHEIMSAILPEGELNGEVPSGFTTVGHIAHLNLRDQYLLYKNLIATVLLDKNPQIRTVINKLDDVGEQSEYRTFSFELLAGDPDMVVETREENCIFRFDYSKVYWNSRLHTEHRRLVELFQTGEMVCDVTAGVGPFAVPAGKRGVFVWANDLNPASYSSLQAAIQKNKVSGLVEAFNEDGHEFIRTATQKLLNTKKRPTIRYKNPFSATPLSPVPPSSTGFFPAPHTLGKHENFKSLTRPKTFNHYVMNLPATGFSFLPSFVSLYAGYEVLFEPFTKTRLPLIHLYYFSAKADNLAIEEIKICDEIAKQLDCAFPPGEVDFRLTNVRDVAPLKTMYCATFRLPTEVAFRPLS